MAVQEMSLDEIPTALDAPFDWESGDVVKIWEGASKLVFHDETLEGVAKIQLRMCDQPSWFFAFEPNVARPEFEILKRRLLHPLSLENAKLQTASVLGDLAVDVSNYPYGTIFDFDDSKTVKVKTIAFAVFQGPNLSGTPLKRGKSSFCGRLEALLPNARITVDKADGLAPADCPNSSLTHIASIEFDEEVDCKEVGSLADSLFRSLSVMRLGWVGLAGPWYYDSDHNLTRVDCRTTKMTRIAGQLGWCQPCMDESFRELLSCIHDCRSDKEKFDSIITAMHYMIESEMCSGE